MQYRFGFLSILMVVFVVFVAATGCDDGDEAQDGGLIEPPDPPEIVPGELDLEYVWSGQGVDLRWSAWTGDEVTGYRVYTQLLNFPPVLRALTDETWFIDLMPMAGDRYTATVQAVDGDDVVLAETSEFTWSIPGNYKRASLTIANGDEFTDSRAVMVLVEVPSDSMWMWNGLPENSVGGRWEELRHHSARILDWPLALLDEPKVVTARYRSSLGLLHEVSDDIAVQPFNPNIRCDAPGFVAEPVVDLLFDDPAARYVRVANTVNELGQAPWRIFADRLEDWNLPDDPEPHTVKVQMRNEFELVSGVYESTPVQLDLDPPDLSNLSMQPVDGADGIDATLSLAWSGASDALSGVHEVAVYCDRGGPATTLVYDGSDGGFQLENLIANEEYRWRLEFRDLVGNVASGDEQSFTTGGHFDLVTLSFDPEGEQVEAPSNVAGATGTMYLTWRHPSVSTLGTALVRIVPPEGVGLVFHPRDGFEAINGEGPDIYFMFGSYEFGDASSILLAELEYQVYQDGATGPVRVGPAGPPDESGAPFPNVQPHMTWGEFIHLGYPLRRSATDPEELTGIVWFGPAP